MTPTREIVAKQYSDLLSAKFYEEFVEAFLIQFLIKN